MKSCSVTIQMKATEQYFSVELFVSQLCETDIWHCVRVWSVGAFENQWVKGITVRKVL